MTKGRARPDATLRRGYSMTMDVNGKLVRSVTQVKRGDKIRTRVADGELESDVVVRSGHCVNKNQESREKAVAATPAKADRDVPQTKQRENKQRLG